MTVIVYSWRSGDLLLHCRHMLTRLEDCGRSFFLFCWSLVSPAGCVCLVFCGTVDTSVLRVAFCSTCRAVGNFGTVPLKVTRQVAVKAKVLIWLSMLLLTAFHPCAICRFWYTFMIFSCNERLQKTG